MADKNTFCTQWFLIKLKNVTIKFNSLHDFGTATVEIGTIVLSRDSNLTDRPRGIDQIDRT